MITLIFVLQLLVVFALAALAFGLSERPKYSLRMALIVILGLAAFVAFAVQSYPYSIIATVIGGGVGEMIKRRYFVGFVKSPGNKQTSTFKIVRRSTITNHKIKEK